MLHQLAIRSLDLDSAEMAEKVGLSSRVVFHALSTELCGF